MVGFECVSYRSGWAHSLGQDRTLSMKCIGKGPYGRDSHMGSAQALRLVGRLCGLIMLPRERHVAETRCPEMRVFWCWQGDSHSESGPVPARRLPRWATSHREAEASRSKSLEVSHSKSWPRQPPRQKNTICICQWCESRSHVGLSMALLGRAPFRQVLFPTWSAPHHTRPTRRIFTPSCQPQR